MCFPRAQTILSEMYYIILPSQSILNKLKYSITSDLDTVIFISSNETLSNNVLDYLNNIKPCSIVSSMTMGTNNDKDNRFQIKTINNVDELHMDIPTDENTYPYNYVFPEGLVNKSSSLNKSQKYTNECYPNDVDIINRMRNLFGPTII